MSEGGQIWMRNWGNYSMTYQMCNVEYLAITVPELLRHFVSQQPKSKKLTGAFIAIQSKLKKEQHHCCPAISFTL